MKKDSMFSLMSEQFKQARGRERLLCCGTSRALGELWPALAGATQPLDRRAASVLLTDHVDGISKTMQGGILSCFQPYRGQGGNKERRD